jgi:acetyl esterase/lipase
LDAYLPARAAGAAARPLVIFCYGGGFTAGRRQDYRFVGAALSAAGYATVLPDYRLYPQVRFPEFLRDAARAVVAAHARAGEWGADGSRIVLMGHSAGAYIAAMLALNPSYLQDAGGDPRWIAGFIGLSGPYDIDPNTEVLDRIFRDTATPAQFKPLSYVRPSAPPAPPALLLHGEADSLVHAVQSQALGDALSAAGVRASVKRHAGRGHADTVAALSLPGRGRAPVLSDVLSSLRALEDAGPSGSPQTHP